MAYTNHLLFNNIFLRNLHPTEEEIASANYLVHESARDWYRNADFSSPHSLVETWIRPLLNQQTLDLVEVGSEFPEAWYLVAPWERESPLAICYVVGERQKLDGHAPDGTLPKGQHWMIQAVNLALQKQEHDLRWIILTNGDQWRLLDAKNLRKYESFLEIDLIDLLKGQDDRLAAYLFHHIVRLEDSLEKDESTGKNKLDAFFEQSIQATEATEKYLKTSVSDNLNTPGGGDGIMAQLCMGLVHAIDPSGTRAFTDAERDEIYRNATYLLYRLLFIFYAESRNLLPMDREDYQAISLNRLVEDAYAVHLNPGNNAIQQTNLWDQLNTLFNAIQYSDEYMGIPPYNGGLFENDDKVYLKECKIANRFLAEALVELAYLSDPNDETDPERIDYRDLSVRHLGSLYEGMIEYRLFIAEEELLARRDKDGKVKYLSAEKTERKPNDELLKKGKVYFAQSPHERKATGTHYTAEDLVERLVKQTVLRLLNERWQEFEPNFTQWLAEIDATPGEAQRRRLQERVDSELEQFVESQVLNLRACDPAMGSGHFLVHIAHQMTNFILWVFTRTPWTNDNINLDADLWRKRIVENCLYGVDINQMAVELAKLSLWLATMQLGQPLSFLDHHLKQGNSLLGASLEEIETLLKQDDFSKSTAKSEVAEARGQYLLLQQVHSLQQKMGEANTLLQKIANQIVSRAEDVHQQELNLEEVEKILTPYKQIGNLVVAQKMGVKITANELHILAKVYQNGSELNEAQNILQNKVQISLGNAYSLHWGLEFPGIFWKEEAKGFDVIVGNPPFLGGLKISGELGDYFLQYLKSTFIPSIGAADLCSYFFRLAEKILNEWGCSGFVATNSIAQGDTRRTGISYLLEKGFEIYFADRYVKWRGDANVEVNLVAMFKSKSIRSTRENLRYLDNTNVPFISSYLDDVPETTPHKLIQNLGTSFQGDIPYGIGFILDEQTAKNLITKDPNNSECLFPYLTGEDVNANLGQKSKRYAICFHDYDFKKASEYPDLMSIVQEKVKPQRDKVNRERNRLKWWLYGEYRKGLRIAISDLSRILVRSLVSEHHILSFTDPNQILSCKLGIFTFDDYYHFALLQSSTHEIWQKRLASTLEARNSYTLAYCYQTFPFPQSIGKKEIEKTDETGKNFYNYRQQIMQQRILGLTKIYNLFNNPKVNDGDIQYIRNLQIDMDNSVIACYGWEDINLQHDFYPNDRKKIRFMPSPAAQREIFTRLVALNQEIAAQEAAQGLVVEPGEEDEIDEETEA
ncbi:MAG: hypothetical protein KGZ93_06535 [Actinobacteria bacterium]|nr:hypothetical protein [Actinomycetota bacterium]